MSTNSATFTGTGSSLLREKSLRRGRDRDQEKVFQVPLALTRISNDNVVRVEEAALGVKSVHLENGECKSISE